MAVVSNSISIFITDKFKITLYGTYAADTVVYDSVIEGGNNVIASIGLKELFVTSIGVELNIQ